MFNNEAWKEEVQEKLKRIIIDISRISLTPDEIQDDSDFIECLGFESMDVIYSIVRIEQEFAIQFTDEEVTLELFMTFADLKNAVIGKMEAKRGNGE